MKLDKDKKLHIIAGFLVALLLDVVVYSVSHNYELSLIAAIVFAFFAGYIKEEYDKRFEGTVEVADILATGLGGILYVLCAVVLGYPN